MDISKTDAKVCVRVQEGSEITTDVTVWGAVSSQILELADHLAAERVTLVVMEATGDYWKPWYFLLSEAGLEVMLVNARQARQIPGRKTDVNDCMWLSDLGAHGLLRGSFVPPAPIRELKDLVRARTGLVRLRGEEAQRLEKLLESAAVKITSKLANILGASGRRMLEAMIAGADDPDALAGLADARVKASREELREALTGRFTPHHAFLAQVRLDVIDSYTAQIAKVQERIDECFAQGGGDGPDEQARKADLAAKRDLLTTIPGVSTLTAERVLAEIGADMAVFPTAKHLTSWAGVAPGSNESAGKVKSSRCRPGDTYLKGALGMAAMAAARTKDTFLQARYKRVMARRGHKRAQVAVMRSMLTAMWTVLSTGKPYTDPGGDYYIKRRPGRAITKAIDQLRAAGLTVTFANTDTAVVT
jgi:transposase